jgi:hypothetical protein
MAGPSRMRRRPMRRPAPTPSLLFWLFADKLVSRRLAWLGLPAVMLVWWCLLAGGLGLPAVMRLDRHGVALLSFVLIATLVFIVYRRAVTRVAGQGVKVNQKEYATTVVGVAFWNLRRKGYITLEPYTKKLFGHFTVKCLGRTYRGLRASLGPEARYDANDSLEYLILLALRNRSPADVSRIIWLIMREGARNPYAAILRLPEGEALRTGCMVRVDAHRNKVMALVRGDTKLEVDTARVATFQNAFETERAAWEQFKTSEPDLYRALLDRCNAGISSRTEMEGG